MCDCLCTCEKERERENERQREREREIQLDFHQSRLVERRVCLRQINYSRPRNDVNTKYKSNKPMERLVLCHRYYDKRQGNSETQYLSAIRTAGCKGSNGHKHIHKVTTRGKMKPTERDSTTDKIYIFRISPFHWLRLQSLQFSAVCPDCPPLSPTWRRIISRQSRIGVWNGNTLKRRNSAVNQVYLSR